VPQNQINMGLCLALGTGLGVSLGVMLGVVIDHIGLGIALGPGIGASLGLAAYFVIEASRRRPFTCGGCGYSTRGLRGTTCPECGRDVSEEAEADRASGE
jgi:hypothetical protein